MAKKDKKIDIRVSWNLHEALTAEAAKLGLALTTYARMLLEFRGDTKAVKVNEKGAPGETEGPKDETEKAKNETQEVK